LQHSVPEQKGPHATDAFNVHAFIAIKVESSRKEISSAQKVHIKMLNFYIQIKVAYFSLKKGIWKDNVFALRKVFSGSYSTRCGLNIISKLESRRPSVLTVY